MEKQVSTIGVLRKHYLIIVAFMAAIGVLSYLLTLGLAPTYAVKSKIFVSSTTDSAIANVNSAPYSDRAVKTIQALITNQTIIDSLFVKTGIDPKLISQSIKSRYVIGTQIIELTVTGKDQDSISQIADFYPGALSGYLQTIQKNTEKTEKISIAIAENPSSPSKTSLDNWQWILMAVIGAFIFGLGVSYVFEMLDNSIHSPQDLSEIGIKHMGDFGYLKKSDENSQVTARQNIFAAEMLREVRTNITSLGGSEKRIVVTSSNPREGKTIFIASLAILLAEAKHRVVLVDADLRSPFVHKVFKVENEVGLGDYLKGKVKAEQTITKTDIKNLFISTAGLKIHDSSESLSQAEFSQYLKWLESEFGADYILIDSPPLGMITDAAVISKKTGGVIFVAEEDKTTKNDLKRIKGAIERVGGKVLGAVLTKVKNGTKRIYGYV